MSSKDSNHTANENKPSPRDSSERDSIPIPNVTATSDVSSNNSPVYRRTMDSRRLSRSAQESGRAEDLIPSASESHAPDTELIPDLLSSVGVLVKGMSQNIADIKSDVIKVTDDVKLLNESLGTVKRKFDKMESDHEMIMNLVDTMTNEEKSKIAKQDESIVKDYKKDSEEHMDTSGWKRVQPKLTKKISTGAQQSEKKTAKPYSKVSRSTVQTPTIPEVYDVPSTASTSNQGTTTRLYSDAIRNKITEPLLQTAKPSVNEFPPLQTVSQKQFPDVALSKPTVDDKITQKPVVEEISQTVKVTIQQENVEPTVEATVKLSVATKPTSEEMNLITEDFIAESSSGDQSNPTVEKPVTEELIVNQSTANEQGFGKPIDAEALPQQPIVEETSSIGAASTSLSKQSISTKSQKPSKSQPKVSKQEKKEARKLKEEAEQLKHEKLYATKHELSGSIAEYCQLTAVERQNTQQQTLSKKLGDKFMSERYEYYKKNNDEIMSMFFMLLKENGHASVYEDMYFLQQWLMHFESSERYLVLEKQYYQKVSKKIHPDTVKENEMLVQKKQDDQVEASEKSHEQVDAKLSKVLEDLFRQYPSNPSNPSNTGEDVPQSDLEKMVDQYIKVQQSLRKTPLDQIDKESISKLQLVLLEQHHSSLTDPSGWNSDESRGLFEYRAMLHKEAGKTREARMISRVYEVLAQRDSDILNTDAFCIKAVVNKRINIYEFEAEYFQLIVRKENFNLQE